MKKFKTNYEWEPFTSYRDITHAPLGYIAKFINSIDKKVVLQILKENKLKYGYRRRSFPLWIKSHGTKRPISYYRKRDTNDS